MTTARERSHVFHKDMCYHCLDNLKVDLEFLAQQPAVQKMRVDIIRFLDNWLPEMLNNHRSYATVSIGCTGGQHRSVYLVNALAQHFQAQWTTLQRHRELDKKSM